LQEILRSENVFELKVIQQFLVDHEIQAVILDEHTGALMSGIGNVFPRLMVLDEDVDLARELIEAQKNDV